MPQRILTLTTDFGLDDHFVGVMKGVILGIAPSARIVDVCHSVSPFEVIEGAFTIAQAYTYFPPGTVHVVVVDPGVGSSRRPIVARAAGQYFVGPDNGVFCMVFAKEKHQVRAVTAGKYFLQDVSHTFHGRDVFAPVAAQLCRGLPWSRLGKLIDDYHRGFQVEPQRIGRRIWSGMVFKADHFGNLITNLETAEFPQLRLRPFELAVGARRLSRLVSTFSDAPPGEPVVVPGSCGYLEIAVNQGNAAKMLGCGTGSPVELSIY